MAIPPSAFKGVIEALPDTWKMKKQSILPYLQKRGVKLEELEYSGLEKQLTNFEGDKLTKQDMLQLEQAREDIQNFYTAGKGNEKHPAMYQDITLPRTDKSTYQENIRTFGKTSERTLLEDVTGEEVKPVRNVTNHFDEPNYLWHTRTSEDIIDGKPTRVVQEIQSDLHQQGRKEGYQGKVSKEIHPDTLEKLQLIKEALDPNESNKNQRRMKLAEQVFREDLGWHPYSSETVVAADKTVTPPELLDIMINEFKTSGGVPDTPYKKNWSRKAIEQEILDATATGKHAIAVPIQGTAVRALKRAPGVQKWYEEYVIPTMKKVAKSIGGEYKEVSPPYKEGEPTVSYGQIILPEDKKGLENLKLYSVGGAEALLISQSLDKGAMPDELKQFLVEEQGMSEEDAQKGVDRAMRLRVESSLVQGASKEELLALAEQQGHDKAYIESLMPSEEDKVDLEASYKEQQIEGLKEIAQDPTKLFSSSAEGAQARIDRVANIYTKYSTMPTNIKVMAGFGTPEDRAQANQDLKELNQFIVNNLEKEGIQAQLHPETGALWVLNEEAGQWEEMDPGLWESIKASRGEIAGGILGGAAAYRGTQALRATPGPWPVKLAAGAGAFVATALGGAAGATLGRHQDIVRNALEAKETVESAIMMDQLKEAAAADVVFSVAGTALFKTAAGGVKIVYKAWDLLAQGNKEGAYRSLKELMHLSDEQVDEIITNWEQLTRQKAPGMTRATKAINVIPRTTPGGEAIVQPAAAMDPVASANAAKEIDMRAKNLLAQADAAASGDISTILRDEMKTYRAQVKQVYSGVKEYGVQEMADTGYRFDYSQLAIDPIIKRASEELTNPALRERALAYLQRVRQLGGVVEEVPTTKTITEQIERPFRRGGAKTTTVTKEVPTIEEAVTPTLRSFEDLLELRRVLNEFGSSKLVKNAKDIELLSTIRKKIDGEISRAAKKHMDQPEEWLTAWKAARTEYGKMFDLEANVLYKQIMRAGTTDKTVARQLMNRAMATDNTFRQVLEKLPPKMQALTENAVMQEFVEQYTKGEAGGLRAVNFPQLNEQLSQIPFTTKKAQDLKRVITQMSEVFKNDVDLARATGTIRTPTFQSYLTTDPVIRAKYEIASTVFNYIKRVLPGSKADSIALVMQTGKVLEKPLHAPTFEALLKQLPEDPTLRNTLKAAQLQLAKFGEPSDYPHVPLYRRTKPGQTLQTSEGPLGKGLYYSIDKGRATSGTKLSTKQVLPQRIAAEDDLKLLLGVENVTPKVIKQHPELKELLQDKGYIGLSLGDQVLVFK